MPEIDPPQRFVSTFQEAADSSRLAAEPERREAAGGRQSVGSAGGTLGS